MSLWWAFNDAVISRIPYAYTNPFVCGLWPVEQCPSFTEEGFSFWQYLLTLAVMGPVTSFVQAYIISRVTGEWEMRKSFKREIAITTVVLFFTSPFLAISYKLTLEGYIGEVYHDESTNSVGKMLLQVLIFNVIADTWFYWVHRMFHEIPWLYRNSHFLHHSAHPVNTFMGNGGDVFELVTQGEMQIFVPPLFVPIQAKYFILNALAMQAYVLLLHNGKHLRFPFHRFIIDPYEHNMHHYYGMKNHNFGLYFTFWDTLMGTHKSKLAAFEKGTEEQSPAEREHKKQKLIPQDEATSLGSHFAYAFHACVREMLPF